MALVFAAYWPSLKGEFLWDDDLTLMKSEVISDPEGLPKIWFSPPPSHPDYFPLTTTCFWLQWRVWGEHPMGYRLLGITLHALCVILFWRLLKEMDLPGAWIAAAVFALHPVNVESAAWISEQKNLIAMVFALPAFLAFVEFQKSLNMKWYWGSLAFFAASVSAKASAVTLPLVFLAYLCWQKARLPSRKDLLQIAPFLGVSIAFSLLVIYFQHVRAIGDWNIQIGGPLSRISGAGLAFWFYLGKALLPLDLSTIYPRWDFDPPRLWQMALAFGTALLILAFWISRNKTLRGIAFGLTSFGLLLLPTLGLLKMSFMRYALVADHFQHLALPALVALVVCGIASLLRSAPFALPANALKAASVLLLCGLIFLTLRRAQLHSDHEALWRDCLARNPDSAQAHNVLGTILAGKNRRAEALQNFEKAVALDPGDALILNNMGIAFSEMGDNKSALPWFQRAIQANSRYSYGYLNLARCYAALANATAALDTLRVGAEKLPNDLPLNSAAGASFLVAEDYRSALPYLQNCERLAPKNPLILMDLATTLEALGRKSEASQLYVRIKSLDPKFDISRPWYP